MQKVVHETKTQNLLKQKCWLYSITAVAITVVVIAAIRTVYEKKCTLLGMSIVAVILLWGFYRDFKFYLLTKFKNVKERNKCFIYSYGFLALLMGIIAFIGKKSKIEFFDSATSLLLILIGPIFILDRASKTFHYYFEMNLEAKRAKMKSWICSLLGALIIAVFLTVSPAFSFHPLLIFALSLGTFALLAKKLCPVENRVFRQDTKLLLILILIAGIGAAILIGMTISGVTFK